MPPSRQPELPARPSADGEPVPETIRIWTFAPAAAATLGAVLVSIFIFGRIPHVQDSIAQLFQARIFAGGRLWAPAPPLPQLFDYANVILANGRWYSQYPPGHSLLLLPGVLAGVPWLTNPLLGGLTVLGVYLLGLELGGPRIARMAAILGVVSPFLLLMSGEFMSHASALSTITFFLVFFFRALRTARTQDGIAAGIFLCLAVLIRPYSAFGMGIPAGIYGLWYWHRRKRPAKALAYIVAGGMAGLILLLLYNWGTTGSPTRFGYTALWGQGYGLGFGKGFESQAHSLERGLLFTWQRAVKLNGRLFEWPLTSLWPIVVALAVKKSEAKLRWLLLAFPVSLLVAHAFYWYQDANDCFGPRYVYEALAPILLLSAMGLVAVGDWLTPGFMRSRSARTGTESAGSRRNRAGTELRESQRDRASNGFLIALGIVAILSISGAVFRMPHMLAGSVRPRQGESEVVAKSRSLFERYGRDYWGVSPDLGESVAGHISDRALVFVDTRVAPLGDPMMRRSARHLRFGSAFAHENPYLDRARVIYAHAAPADWVPQGENAGAELFELMRAEARQFPGRRIYFYQSGWEAPQELNFASSAAQ